MNARLERSRFIEPALIALAVVNLAAGLWRSTITDHTADLEQVMFWTRAWLAGINPYAAPGAVVDYPPWALMLLSPLALVAPEWRVPVWKVINIGLVLVLAWRLARATGEPSRQRRWLVWLIASTAAAHTLTQFSLLSSVLAVAGGFATSAVGAALGVGLGLMKPQIGGVVLVWWALTRQWKKVGLSLLVPAALTVVFAMRTGTTVQALMTQYVQILTWVHGSPVSLTGHTELRVWLAVLWPEQAARLAVAASLAVVLLLPGAIGAWRRRSWNVEGTLEGFAFCGAVSLLAMRHLSYDFLLLWPALAAWRTGPFTARDVRTNAAAAFWLLAAVLVVGLPGWTRAAVSAGASPGLLVLTEVDRLTALAAWAYLARRLWRGRI